MKKIIWILVAVVILLMLLSYFNRPAGAEGIKIDSQVVTPVKIPVGTYPPIIIVAVPGQNFHPRYIWRLR